MKKITVVVDANIIISAVLGGIAGQILFNRHFNIVTTAQTLLGVKKYIPILANKISVPPSTFYEILKLLPISIKERKFYEGKINEAFHLIGKRDPKDTEILALALKISAPLWSNDKDFEGIPNIILLKTGDFL